ncbi:superoxide dismutase [Candidatus Microgenomates bacterium]|nr:superoxide dismutase [Candidatus Microgenomates bacterium]
MFTLPNLPYAYEALEPYIDRETMHFHHDKHHATYVANLNDLLKDQKEFAQMEIGQLVRSFNKIPEAIRQKVINNAGGVINHNHYWQLMSPKDEKNQPQGKLLEALNSAFGGLEKFQENFSAKALGRFGSGWIWLIAKDNKLEIVDTANQDTPESEGYKPLLTLDVWEHAYYLKYQNRRADYIKAWWNVVNWKEVEKRFNR